MLSDYWQEYMRQNDVLYVWLQSWYVPQKWLIKIDVNTIYWNGQSITMKLCIQFYQIVLESVFSFFWNCANSVAIYECTTSSHMHRILQDNQLVVSHYIMINISKYFSCIFVVVVVNNYSSFLCANYVAIFKISAQNVAILYLSTIILYLATILST